MRRRFIDPDSTTTTREQARDKYLRGFKTSDRYDVATDWDAGADWGLTLATELAAVLERQVNTATIMRPDSEWLPAARAALARYRTAVG